ncbi:MAG: hypothetical protein JKX71_08615 [Amylibacter sp.]|nr:hypothetical protein [Amylibacter sp.]
MRLNDKAISFITGVVLLLGVGTVVHKGDELFGSKANTTQVAKADTGLAVQTDAQPIAHERSSIQMPDSITTALPSAKTTITDFELVRAEQIAPVTMPQPIYNTLQISPAEMDCALKLTAKSLRGARVQLAVIAPCHKNKIITITHAGLRFNEILDDKGMITIIIPVLSDPATIEVSFADGASKSISAPAKDLSSLQRSGIAWVGQADLQLHVDERYIKASKNTQITAQNTRSYKQSYLQGSGYITTLGNTDVESGAFVQIYSIENLTGVFVDFNVVLHTKSRGCNTPLMINTVRYSTVLGAQISRKNIPIANCSAQKGKIVLKNILRDLIVAQRN